MDDRFRIGLVMVGAEMDGSVRALSACNRIEHLIESGHTIRALVELRALLEEGGFWANPDVESPFGTAYLKGVEGFAARGISESELNITLHA